METNLLARLRQVRLVVMDVDGVLTDGGMFYTEEGEAFKKFNARDGMGISLLQKSGIMTAIVTSERTAFGTRRAEKLGIVEVHTDAQDKFAVVREICQRHGLGLHEVCYIGDDINDLAALQAVGFACVVADGLPSPKAAAHYVTHARGGEGAVREVCELIVEARRTTPNG